MENIKYEMTETYYNKLNEELIWRKNEERDRILKAIAEARSQGDLSENADYSSAREAQKQNDHEIEVLEEKLKHAVIIQAKRIVVKFKGTPGEKEYLICGSESNPFDGKISSDSPLAKAVNGHNAGDIVYMSLGGGKEMEIKIVYIEN